MLRLACVSVAALLAVGAVACGGSDDPDDGGSGAEVSLNDLLVCLTYAGLDARDGGGGGFSGGTDGTSINAEAIEIGAPKKPIATVIILSQRDAEQRVSDIDAGASPGLSQFLGDKISANVYLTGSLDPWQQIEFEDPSGPKAPSGVRDAVAGCVE